MFSNHRLAREGFVELYEKYESLEVDLLDSKVSKQLSEKMLQQQVGRLRGKNAKDEEPYKFVGNDLLMISQH